MGNQAPTFQNNKKHPLRTCLPHPINSPLQKLGNILHACWCHPIGAPYMFYPNVFFLRQATRIGVSHVWNLLIPYKVRKEN